MTLVATYNPAKQAIVRVPKQHAEMLNNAGYIVGDTDARMIASQNDWGNPKPGSLAVPAALSGADLKHPDAMALNQASQEHNEPIQAERLLHAVGLEHMLDTLSKREPMDALPAHRSAEAAHKSLDKRTAEPAYAMVKTVDSLLGKKDPELPDYVLKPDNKYKELENKVLYAKQNATGLAMHIQDGLGKHLENQLPLQLQVTIKALDAVQHLNDNLPQNMNDPTLVTQFNPTKEQKLRFLDTWHTITNFSNSMENPNAFKVSTAETTSPEQLGLLRDVLRGHLTANGIEGLSPLQQRKISIIMGEPIIPQHQASYIKGLQANAPAQDKPPAPPGGAGLGVHGAQTVTLRDAPDSMKQQLGATF